MEATTESAMSRRLYKSRQHRVIDGICGGIAEYFEVDPTIVRIVWVMITLLGGSGFVLYIAAMIIMPVNPVNSVTAQPTAASAKRTDRKRFWGVFLILFGTFILFTNLGLFEAFQWWHHLSWEIMFPIVLIVVGLWFMYVHTRKPIVVNQSTQDTYGEQSQSTIVKHFHELKRSKTDRKLFGVCGGIASYFNVDSTIVRVLYIFLVLASFGWGLLLYLIMTIVMPEEKPTTT